MNFDLDSGNFELRVHDKTRFTTASQLLALGGLLLRLIEK